MKFEAQLTLSKCLIHDIYIPQYIPWVFTCHGFFLQITILGDPLTIVFPRSAIIKSGKPFTFVFPPPHIATSHPVL